MSKYKAIKGQMDGHKFDSQRELKWYGDLKMLERAGKIAGLQVHPKFPIVIGGAQVRYPKTNRPMTYYADFAWFEGNQRRVIDVKGLDTPASKIKRALVAHIYGISVEVVK